MEEKHTSQCRGHWVPIEIWDMAEREELCWTDLRLLMLVDSLVRSKGAGCWASNTWLGERLNRSKNHISAMIAKLKGMGLLVEIGTVTVRNLKYRILETSWSRAAPNSQSVDEAADSIRECIEKQTKSSVVVEMNSTIMADRNGRVTADRNGSIPEDRYQITPSERILERPDTVAAIAADGVSVDETVVPPTYGRSDGAEARNGAPPNGSAKVSFVKEGAAPARPGNTKTDARAASRARASFVDSAALDRDGFGKPRPKKSAAQELAERLRDILNRHGKTFRYDYKAWARDFDRLLAVKDRAEIERMLDAHDKYLDHYQFWPQCQCPKTFHERWDSFVYNLKQAEGGDRPKSVEVSSEAASLAASLATDCFWPKGSAVQLPAVVQDSLDGYTTLYMAIDRLRGRKDDVGRFACYLDGVLGLPADFVYDWYVAEARRLAGWEDWSGTLQSFRAEKLSKKGRQWAEEYSHAALWDELLAAGGVKL